MTNTDKFIEEYREYAEKQGFSLNPDKRIVEAVAGGLLNREEKFGQKYCPCRKITGDKEEDKKIIYSTKLLCTQEGSDTPAQRITPHLETKQLFSC